MHCLCCGKIVHLHARELLAETASNAAIVLPGASKPSTCKLLCFVRQHPLMTAVQSTMFRFLYMCFHSLLVCRPTYANVTLLFTSSKSLILILHAIAHHSFTCRFSCTHDSVVYSAAITLLSSSMAFEALELLHYRLNLVNILVNSMVH
jgi:hypothetical protein